MKEDIIVKTGLSEIKSLAQGKVRDIYNLGDALLIIATDRISAFDVILSDGIPYKGKVLTALSEVWFKFIQSITPNHLITAKDAEIIKKYPVLEKYTKIISGRSMLVKKAKVFPVECVVRGYLAGSGWKEYKQTNSICGIKLPDGLKESEQLPEPIFTPSTKAVTGHDENITFEQMQQIVGDSIAQILKKRSLAIYNAAHHYALTKGIIISDTKLEWGQINDEIILVDEVLTPDSSRFWPKDKYTPGKPQSSFDKQFVRDYLESIGWNKQPPAPKLPQEIIRKTSEKYLDAYKQLTGQVLKMAD